VRRAKPPEPFTFFVDECLGRAGAVLDSLRGALEPGERIELPAPGTTDESWLPSAGENGWLCISKDRALSKTPHQLQAILELRVALFLLGEASGAEHARRLGLALPTIRQVARHRGLALIARIGLEGDLILRYENGEKLDPHRPVKAKKAKPTTKR
jgi:hypothetical protein